MKSLNRFFLFLLIVCLFVFVSAVFYSFLHIGDGKFHTGYDVTDIGYINLTVDSYVAIDIPDPATLSFGGCEPGNVSGFIRLDNTVKDSVAQGPTCDQDNNDSQWITIQNLGNVYVNVSLVTECSSDSFIGGTNPQLNYTTIDCFGGTLPWSEVSNETPTLVCTNMTPVFTGFGEQFNFSVGALIPPDAVGYSFPCNSTQNHLTFFAERND